MELRQLKSFIHLAETLNFSTTAKELFITQSTLSHQILQLEGELGQPLFYRNSHEVTLTEAGQTLLPLAKDTVRSAEHCQLRMDELKNVMSGELRIGVTFSFVSIIAATVKAFLHEHPHVGINVTQSTMAELIEQLTNHELDFVVSYKPIKSNPKVESRVLFQLSTSIMHWPSTTALRWKSCSAMIWPWCVRVPVPAIPLSAWWLELTFSTKSRWK